MISTARTLFVSLALIPALASAQSAEPRPIALAEAVRMAQRNSPASVQALGAVRTGRAQVISSLSQYIPRIGGSMGAQKSEGSIYFQGRFEPLQGDPWSYSKGYNASLQLFDGGQRWFNYRAAQASLNASHESERLQDYNTALSVKQQYYAVLAAREALSAAERQMEQAEQQLKISFIRFRAGAVARTDSLRSAIAVGNARLAIITARSNLDAANAGLTRLVGTAFDVTAIESDTSENPRVEVERDALITMAVDGPSTRAAGAQFSSAKASRRATITTYLPTVFMSYNWGTNRSSKEFEWGGPGKSQSTGMGFSAQYTLFGGYQREAQAVQAAVNEDNAEAGLRDARALARQNAIQYLSAVRSAEETISLQQLTVAQADEDLRLQQQRYANGGATVVDLAIAQTTLQNARSALISARFQARTTKAQIEALIGKEIK